MLLRKRDQFDPEDADLLEDIVFEAEHMTALTAKMLLLARLDAGKLQREHEMVRLVEVAAHAVRRAQAAASEKQVTLQIRQREPADQLYILGNRMLLEQAVMIVLENAIKYNRPGGKVDVWTCLTGKEVRLDVSDTGVGIAPEHLPRVLERFYRIDKASTQEDEGAGLGLSIAQSIAAIHDGALTLKSTLGQGTTATFVFPLPQES